jgi:mannose-6-phosphate isomerase-like protein (cupin superfamily)/heme-degrading monooxygenase HmoA
MLPTILQEIVMIIRKTREHYQEGMWYMHFPVINDKYVVLIYLKKYLTYFNSKPKLKIMNRLLVVLTVVITLSASAQSLSKRVTHNDPSKYRELSAVHAGAGKMGFTQLIGRTELSTNFLYLHTGSINAKSGIGQHFHHTIEEMFVILDGEAEFTVNGRTSKIKGPALVPCKMGNSHGIYNSGSTPIRWMNFAVSTIKGRGDNFDLGDDRVGAKPDPIPQFVSGQLKKELLKPNSNVYTGNGILYRRILGPDVFSTSWDHVDHLIIPAGSAAGPRQLEGFEEVYYVIKGSGIIGIGADTTSVKADNAFYGLLGEKLNFTNSGKDDLELLVIGIATSKQQKFATQVRLNSKAMVLQMDFVVAKENADAFEKMYSSIYVPAMTVQKGYLESKLLRLFPENIEKEIEGEATDYNYQIQISFATEQDRRNWVGSAQHKIAWPAATSLAKSYKWRGYDVMGDDYQR